MTDFTVTSPSTTLFYGGDIAVVIIPQNQYFYDYVRATWISGFNAPTPAEDSEDYSEDFVLSQLSPLERWRYVAKHNRSEFIIWLLALLGGAIMLIMASVHLGVSIFSSAVAQNALDAIVVSSHDTFDWAIAGLMSIGLLWCLAIVSLAQKESKISFGKDMSKMIMGFVIGFLAGKAR